MFCPNCGSEVGEGQRFCANCGHPLAMTHVVPASASAPQATAASPVVPEPLPLEPVANEAEEARQAAEEAMASLDGEPTVVVERYPLSAAYAAASQASDAGTTAPQAIPQAAAPEASQHVPQPMSPHPSQAYAPTQAIPQPVDQTVQQPVPQAIPQPVPQPVQPSASLQGSSAYGGSYAQASPAQAMTPQVVPAAQEKRSRNVSTLAKVLGVLAAVGLVGGALLSVLSGTRRGTSEEKPAIESVKLTDGEGIVGDITGLVQDVNEYVSSNVSDQDDAASGDASASASHDRDADLFESHGYPTLYAYMELSGEELYQLVTSKGYFYYTDTDTGRSAFVKRDGTIIFNVVTLNGELDEEGLQAFTNDEPALYVTLLEGFDSVGEVFDALAQGVVVESSKYINDLEMVAVVTSPSGRSYLVDVSDAEDGDYDVDLYTPEAIEFGIFDALMDGEFGYTAQEAFSNFNG